jgi:hypothetical protein
VTVDLGRTFTGGPDVTVRCTCNDGSSVDLVAAGGTVSIHVGSGTATVDLHLRAAHHDPLELLTGTGGHGAAEVLEARAGADSWRPIPPFDVDPDTITVPPLVGADAVVAHETVDTPVGTFDYYDTFTDGALTARTGGRPSTEPLVSTRMSFAARISPPEVPLLEQLEGAQLRGRDDAALMFVAGLYDRAQIRHALRGARTTTNRHLTRLAAHTSTLEFRDLVTHAIGRRP